MTKIYKIQEIRKNEATQTGHVVYPKATYTNRQSETRKIVYKENKHQNRELTQFEMAFGALARLLIDSNLTPQQHFVVDEDEHEQVQGLACEHLCYMIAGHEAVTNESKKQFYTLDEQGKPNEKKHINNSEDIPYYFLNQLKPGFFAGLSALYKSEDLTIDMASLASLLTTSYLLEEDDLHKGNFGCYFIEQKGKPHAVFFKIDHDMMFADALMSYGHGRVHHWLRNDAAFNITARDLLKFPLLRDSVNHYWPTSFSFISNPFDTKVYRDFSDLRAFVKLAKNEDFNQAKWRSFLKQILMPPALLRETLNQTLDNTKPDEKAKINMIVQAFASRQSRLRTELLTVKPFIKFVNEFTETQGMLEEMTVEISNLAQKTGYQESINKELEKYKVICQTDPNDTPLHMAIRLGDFRYYDKWHSVYAAYLNVANGEGKTPLDLALSMIKEPSSEDVRSDAKCIVNYLLHRGAISATQTAREYKYTYKKYINYKFKPVEYNRKVAKIKNFEGLKALMQELDEDFRFSLKMKKKLSLFCLSCYISKSKNPIERADVLRQFKKGLNGDSTQHFAPLAELQFIRQLRSRLWIVRKFRGLIGGTSTQIAMNQMIDRELKRLQPKSPGCLSFFNCFKGQASPEQAESTMPEPAR